MIAIVLIRTFLASPFIVEGASMDATFHDNDYLIVDKLSYRFIEPQRGDIVVFRYPHNPSIHHIKRIVGMPGDTISVHDGKVTVSNVQFKDATFEETYVLPGNNLMLLSDSRTLGENEYYFMGDNRDNSLDSRRYGAVSGDFISGRVVLRLFPFDMVGLFPGRVTHYTLTTSQ
ncbi:signal peptidase I [Candidatus Kaiserbacteria bacterium RIFCSPHIGHO2_02_FULL_49_34]|uniref:Signal peptidase I n=1 Tax=Candidatus Kaiserbacteria bacterium RIFCSPHIGHO2_02_FULL_49_34 TaxID=1798491 RepID=A0A1F6DKI9_9BACT|nr:MAG: signal peptidase I [Candidatus Kaiserbacteria bacterium RIFCSPHIGHO2_02_FULL_49_34]